MLMSFSRFLFLQLALLGISSLDNFVFSAEEKPNWPWCQPDRHLDGYLAGLPTTLDRETSTTDLSAQSITIIDEARYELTGLVDIRRADQRLAGDQVTYDSNTQNAEAVGNVHYQDQKLLINAQSAQTNLEQNQSTLNKVQYQLLDDASDNILSRGNGTAEKAIVTNSEKNKKALLSTVSFSTCDPTSQAWSIQANEIELDHESNQGKARNVKLRFFDTTLFALPYASFPIRNERKSGFLTPSIGSSSQGGFDLWVPYYFNLAPNYDATLNARAVSNRGLMLGGEFRYLNDYHQSELRADLMPHDRKANKKRFSWSFLDQGFLSPQLHWVADLRRVSDNRYFEDFGDSLNTSSIAYLPSLAYLRGQGAWWNFEIGGDDTQITNPRINPKDEPYRRLPRITFQAEKELLYWGNVGLRGEATSFHKDHALNGQRYDFSPYFALPIEHAGWFVRPEILFRYTSYDLNRSFESTPHRSMPIFNLDGGLVLEKPTQWADRQLVQTLEPRVYYLRAPYRNQDALPIFDTQELDFSFAQLFRPNRFTGADRQADANQLTLAISSRLIDHQDGQEFARASIGQIRYFSMQRVQLPETTPTDFNGSDYAAELDLSLSDQWHLTFSQLYDPNFKKTDLAAAALNHRFSDRGALNLAYRYRRNEIEHVDVSALIPIYDNWRLIGRWNYSLRDNKTVEALSGLEYDSCCYAFRILGRHYIHNIEGDSSNGIFLELELKGLGSLGRRSEDFLEQSIKGYR
jgi:LPS-assembly protein